MGVGGKSEKSSLKDEYVVLLKLPVGMAFELTVRTSDIGLLRMVSWNRWTF